jgi:hypothetical protein
MPSSAVQVFALRREQKLGVEGTWTWEQFIVQCKMWLFWRGGGGGHRYLMNRLSLQVLPVTSCIVDSAVIYIMVAKFRNTICPPPPQLSLHRRAALPSNSNGTRSVYSRKNQFIYCDLSMEEGVRDYQCDMITCYYYSHQLLHSIVMFQFATDSQLTQLK